MHWREERDAYARAHSTVTGAHCRTFACCYSLRCAAIPANCRGDSYPCAPANGNACTNTATNTRCYPGGHSTSANSYASATAFACSDGNSHTWRCSGAFFT